jgi:hypothetical protein
MASQINYNWTPAGGAKSISQDVEYKRDIDTPWNKGAVGLAPNVAAHTFNDEGLEDNRVYLLRILNHCTGGEFYSAHRRVIKFTCPALTLTKTNRTITVAFAHSGRSVNQYLVKLFNAAGNNLLDTKIVNGSIPANISIQFTDLEPNTQYRVRVEPYANELFKNDCAMQIVTTDAGSGCAVPTITGATIS